MPGSTDRLLAWLLGLDVCRELRERKKRVTKEEEGKEKEEEKEGSREEDKSCS